MKKYICIFVSLVILFALGGCYSAEEQSAKEICLKIAENAVKTSYDSYDDYSALSDEYKKSVPEDYYHMMYYRENDNGDYGKLGQDYYETNKVENMKADISGEKITVTYSYTYECLKVSDDSLLRGSSYIPVTITFEKKNNDYVIVDFYEQP